MERVVRRPPDQAEQEAAEVLRRALIHCEQHLGLDPTAVTSALGSHWLNRLLDVHQDRVSVVHAILGEYQAHLPAVAMERKAMRAGTHPGGRA